MLKVGILLLPCYAETLTNARLTFCVHLLYSEHVLEKDSQLHNLVNGKYFKFYRSQNLVNGNNSTRKNILVKYVWIGFLYQRWESCGINLLYSEHVS